MSLTAPYKVSLNPQETAVILTDDNNITRIIQRGAFIPSQIGTTDIALTFIINGKSESIKAPFAQWQDAGGTPLAANQYDTLVALSNFMGFKKGNEGTVTAVTASLPLESSGGTAPNISAQTQDVTIQELTLVAGTVTYTDAILTVNSRCIGYAYTGVGVNSSFPIIATPAAGSMTFSTGQAGDTATFVATILISII